MMHYESLKTRTVISSLAFKINYLEHESCVMHQFITNESTLIYYKFITSLTQIRNNRTVLIFGKLIVIVVQKIDTKSAMTLGMYSFVTACKVYNLPLGKSYLNSNNLYIILLHLRKY